MVSLLFPSFYELRFSFPSANNSSSEVGEAGGPSQVVVEPPELGVDVDVVCPDLATLFCVAGENRRKSSGGREGGVFRATFALSCI